VIRWLVAAALISAGFAPQLTAQGATPALEQAMDDYEHGRYVKAEAGLRAAAEGGNLRAQELLGYMYAYGPKAYPGIAFDPHEAALWFERAARGGSVSARYMYCSLTRNANTYRIRSGPCFTERGQGTDQAGRE
jgi:TPR repeat protein